MVKSSQTKDTNKEQRYSDRELESTRTSLLIRKVLDQDPGSLPRTTPKHPTSRRTDSSLLSSLESFRHFLRYLFSI